MNHKEKEEIELLEKCCDLRKEQDFERYTSAISALRKSRNTEVLKRMISCLRDVDAGEVQYELVEACEAFNDAEYVDAFITEVPRRWTNAPTWYALMLCSILNSRPCRKAFKDRMRTASKKELKFFRQTIGDIGGTMKLSESYFPNELD